MTKKELSWLYYLKKEIKLQEQRIEELEAKAASCTTQINGMPSGSEISDKVGNFAAEIADLKSLLELNPQKRVYELNILERYIQSVDDPLIRQIMHYRFAKCYGWPKTAYEIGGNNSIASLKMKLYRFFKNS